MDKKLTDAEIVKALERLKNTKDYLKEQYREQVKKCPYAELKSIAKQTYEDNKRAFDIAIKAIEKFNRQKAEIKRLELSNAMLTNNCDNQRQANQHLQDEIRNLVFQQGPKGERGKSGMIATCPACGRSCDDITWVADIDVCKCTCGWQSEPGECDYKKSSCYERELYGFAELMKQALPSWLHPVVDTVLKEMVGDTQ